MINKQFRFSKDITKTYNAYGFAIVKVFNLDECRILKKFAKDWVYSILKEQVKDKRDSFPLEKYHIWSKKLHINHQKMFCAGNRYTSPNKEIKRIICNKDIKTFLKGITKRKFRLWDGGLGSLGFRLIRPGVGDGYPLSRKEWGPAKKVISCWIPIIGYSSRESLNLVPESNLKEYTKYMPRNDKFAQDEYRFAGNIDELNVYKPELKKGEAIFFHPKTLHSEDVVDSDITRLNLEIRFDSD